MNQPLAKIAPAFRIKLAAGKSGEIVGFGSIFGNVDSYGDVVEPGAFTATIAAHAKAGTMPKMLWQHDHRAPIGSWKGIRETAEGLWLSGQINLESSWGRDAWAALEAGNVDGLSIGYRVVKSRPEGILTHLDEIDLLEVSVVTFPANHSARVQEVKTKRDLEEALRGVGLSRSQAASVAKGWTGADDAAGDLSGEERKALLDRINKSRNIIRNL